MTVGRLCLVLHTHLPWLAHHGSWPVGEEWLYQAWSTSYLPVVEVLDSLAAEGRTDLVTLGVTPVIAAQLDDPYCLAEQQTWMGFWAARALELASHRDPVVREAGAREHLASQHAMAVFDQSWSRGGSAPLRRLADAGVIELLGGPSTHPFLPLLDERVATHQLTTGLDDARVRFGQAPAGIWAPECGYRPGLESIYANAGVSHLLVDGPTMRHVGASTAAAHTLGDTEVVAVARDLDITYRVWSPRKGYPGGAWYRDFYAVDEASGFRRWRVTSTSTNRKAHYDPEAARAAVENDAHDFVTHVRNHLARIRDERNGRPGLAVAAYDTELFGHWWHEGPQWLERVLRLLPEADVEVTTVQNAINAGAVEGRVDLEAGSWGSGKDWRVWQGEAVAHLVADNDALQSRLITVVDKFRSPLDTRDPLLDQLTRIAHLSLSSDWAFMVTKDSAAGYALDRHRAHHAEFHRLADLIESGRTDAAQREAREQARRGTPFPHLDARLIDTSPV